MVTTPVGGVQRVRMIEPLAAWERERVRRVWGYLPGGLGAGTEAEWELAWWHTL